jgi:ATP-dependent Clp protease ATP-binding subunit ClpX
MLELDGVELTFDEEALHAMASQALRLKTGARGLRSIMEKTMMNVMFETPSDPTISSCRITEKAVLGEEEPSGRLCKAS